MLRRLLTTAALTSLLAAATALADPGETESQSDAASYPLSPVATGTGGAAATMSPDATAAAIEILQRGGNAVDAAVAAAATLGVSEPFVAGPGGGGYFLYYRARDRRVFTIDGRETAPKGATPTQFLKPDGTPMDFTTAVASGLSVGVPGMVATWGEALDRWGTQPLKRVLQPAIRTGRQGFVLDAALVKAITDNEEKLARFPASAALFLPHGEPPKVGDILRNRDLARTYKQLGRRGWRWFYRGPIAKEIADTVQLPPVAISTPPVAGGSMTASDLRDYDVVFRDPVSWRYRGHRIYGMAPSSSGGTTVGEAMNILEHLPRGGSAEDALHRYLEASRVAFADRGEYVGDPAFVKVPVTGLLSDGFAAQRAKLIGDRTATSPVEPGNPWPFNRGDTSPSRARAAATADSEAHTNHLVVADRHGNVVSYTNTIEQIAGSGITVANRGFLLNNELTDFNFPPGTANSVQPGKRPRSSMSPTIVTKRGRVVEAIGSPGGSTIITTVLQTLLNQFDGKLGLPQAIEAPRASQRNSATTTAEPQFIERYGPALQARGHAFAAQDYIGIVAGLRLFPGGRMQAATESWRGGGGSAMVVRPG